MTADESVTGQRSQSLTEGGFGGLMLSSLTENTAVLSVSKGLRDPDGLSASEAPSASEQLAGVLRRAVAIGTFEPEERLPNERILAERFGVSRMTIRAAFRILVQEGLLLTSRGRNGGTVVATTPAPGAKSRSGTPGVDRFVERVRGNLEVRLAVEPLAAELAALRAGDEERAGILRLVEREATGIRHYRLLDSRLHLLIARASDNESLTEVIELLRTEFFLWADAAWVRLDWGLLSPSYQNFGSSHRRLAQAIADGDSAQSRALMHAHVEEGLQQVKTIVESARGQRE